LSAGYYIFMLWSVFCAMLGSRLFQAQAFSPSVFSRQCRKLACITVHRRRIQSMNQPTPMGRRVRSNLHQRIFHHTVENILDDANVQEETMMWLRRVVIGLNLCPFAEKPLREKLIRTRVVRGDDDEIILSAVFDELVARADSPGTTLIICPECHPESFELYLNILHLIEEGLIKDDETFEGIVQVAAFHPHFQFEGSEPDDVDNWTNRSPYPLFHILREDEVSQAVDRLDGDAGKVWRRNAKLIQSIDQTLGRETLQNIMRAKDTDSAQGQLRAILKQVRLDFDKDQT
jgi:hypothetical protein